MKLAAYLSENRLTVRAFAEMTNSTVSGATKWVRNERMPRPSAMRKITEVTHGKVTANDFVDLIAPSGRETGPPSSVAHV